MARHARIHAPGLIQAVYALETVIVSTGSMATEPAYVKVGLVAPPIAATVTMGITGPGAHLPAMDFSPTGGLAVGMESASMAPPAMAHACATAAGPATFARCNAQGTESAAATVTAQTAPREMVCARAT